MNEQEHEIERLLNEPPLPAPPWIASTILFVCAYGIAYYDKIINLLAITALTFLVLSGLILYYLRQSMTNKKVLYIAYKESQKTLKSQIALNQKQDEELINLQLIKTEELREYLISYLTTQAATTVPVSQQRKDD